MDLFVGKEPRTLPDEIVESKTAGPLVPTFVALIGCDDDETSASSSNLIEQPDIVCSTRDFFVKEAHNRALLGSIAAYNPDSVHIVSKIKISFAKLIAKDWNLVISQMSDTLDEIDSKMSDNIMLRENVLAWRRLLCSWRSNLPDYSLRLQETMNLLLEQTGGNDIEITTKFRKTPSSLAHEPSRITPLALRGHRPQAGTSNDWHDIIAMFDILILGLEKVETRVTSSFQAMMSSMSIIESEKAILQGAAITRLTELAFFFIPLSFTAAFFSMQVKVCSFPTCRRSHLSTADILILAMM
jgi:Mg2+ and Co2+ transporter CorA